MDGGPDREREKQNLVSVFMQEVPAHKVQLIPTLHVCSMVIPVSTVSFTLHRSGLGAGNVNGVPKHQ